MLAGELAQRGGGQGCGVFGTHVQRTDVDLALALFAVVHHQHVPDRRMLDQLDLDVGQRHAHTAHLHVAIHAAVEHQRAVMAIAPAVTGTKCTYGPAVLIDDTDEFGLCQRAVFQVAQGQVDACRMNAADNACWAMRSLGVENQIAVAR